jgi:anti-anti-sigma factor
MEIQEQSQGAVVVLKPVGTLTEGDADVFRERVMTAAGKNMGRVIVDASGVTFVDSRGIEALVDVTEHLGDGGRVLKLCGNNANLKQVLELTGWASAFEFFDDSSAAVRSFL